MKENYNLCTYTLIMLLPRILIVLGLFPANNIAILFFDFIVFIAAMIHVGIEASIKQAVKLKRNVILIHLLFTVTTILINCLALARKTYTLFESLYDVQAIVAIIMTFYAFVLFPEMKIKREEILNMLRCLIYIGLFCCVVNVIINFSNMVSLSLSTSTGISISSIFLNRNAFGCCMYLSTIALLYYVQLTSMKRKYAITIFLVFIINLLFTISRGSILSVAIFLTMYLFQINWEKKFPIVCVVIALAIIVMNSEYAIQLLRKFIIREYSGSSGRVERWQAVLLQVRKNPMMLMGLSAAGFKRLLNDLLMVKQVDNAYIEILLTYGVLGLSLYVWSFIYIIKEMYIASRGKDKNCVENSVIFAVLSFMIYSIFEANIIYELGFLQWVGLFLFILFPISLRRLDN